jgi:hypothetical protein
MDHEPATGAPPAAVDLPTACRALLHALATDTLLTDDEADALAGAMPDAEGQKALLVALKCHGLIRAEQAAFLVGYVRGLRSV